MEIKSPGPELIGQALRARSAEYAREGKLSQAADVQKDLVTLQRAPGGDLYEKHFQATNATRSNWPAYDSLAASWKAHPGFFGLELLGAGGVAVAIWNPHPLLAGVGAAVALGVVATHVIYQQKARKRGLSKATLAAIGRHQDYIRAFTPSAAAAPLNIERGAFVATLQGQEARLVESGSYDKAGQLRRLREGLTGVPGNTVDELFQNLIQDGSKKPVLDLLQGDCSQPVFEGLQALAEVVKLTNPGATQSLQEGAEAVIVGGVVIKKRS